MKHDIAPYFTQPYIFHRSAVAERVFRREGREFMVRRLWNHLLFRDVERNEPEQTFFFHNAEEQIPANGEIPEEWFWREWKAGRHGRFLIHRHPGLRDCCAPLFLLPNGRGFFQEPYTNASYSSEIRYLIIHFVWYKTEPHHREAHWKHCRQLLDGEAAFLQRMCEEVFADQVWPKMLQPYVTLADTPDVPITFEQGSEEELARLTRWICHTEPGLFEEGRSKVTVSIYSREKASGKRCRIDGGEDLSPRLQFLFERALAEHVFSGIRWTNGYACSEGYVGHLHTTPRRDYRQEPRMLIFRVERPSLHERAEAFLQLQAWLQDRQGQRTERFVDLGEPFGQNAN